MKYFKFTVQPAGSNIYHTEVIKYENLEDYYEVENDCNCWGITYCEVHEYLAIGDTPEENIDEINNALEEYWDNCMWRWDEITETEYNSLREVL